MTEVKIISLDSNGLQLFLTRENSEKNKLKINENMFQVFFTWEKNLSILNTFFTKLTCFFRVLVNVHRDC